MYKIELNVIELSQCLYSHAIKAREVLPLKTLRFSSFISTCLDPPSLFVWLPLGANFAARDEAWRVLNRTVQMRF